MKNVVVIGGGHGLSTILRGIKDIANINIKAIVTVADDGGSTGRLRERYAIPAMGDIRNVLLALSSSDTFLQQLLEYRFEGQEESDVVGHSLGNLILTALTDITGSFPKAINEVAKMLKVKGDIIPSTLDNVFLYAKMDDDTIVKGEANIPSLIHDISYVFYHQEVSANKKAIEAINDADYIFYGIGSLYTSILPNTIIKGINETLNKSKAKKYYFVNCMTQSNETYNYDLKRHIDAFKKHHTPVDVAIMASNEVPKQIQYAYAKENSIEVVDNHDSGIEVLKYDLLTFDNNLARHEPLKIKKVVESLI